MTAHLADRGVQLDLLREEVAIQPRDEVSRRRLVADEHDTPLEDDVVNEVFEAAFVGGEGVETRVTDLEIAHMLGREAVQKRRRVRSRDEHAGALGGVDDEAHGPVYERGIESRNATFRLG